MTDAKPAKPAARKPAARKPAARTDQATKVAAAGRPAAEVKPTPDNPAADPAQAQFPSLTGRAAVEVAERSADQEEPADAYQKVYVVYPPLADWTPPDGDDDWHRPNLAATLQEAVNRGLHPQSEATYVGSELHPDGHSWCLRYSVPVVPAVVDPDPNAANAPAHSPNVDHSYPAGVPLPNAAG